MTLRPVKIRPRTVLVGGQTLNNVHDPKLCAERHCCIHNPSNHHMLTWPQNYREDRRLMERICPHGVGHPDPDDPSLNNKIHACDGCCSSPKTWVHMI